MCHAVSGVIPWISSAYYAAYKVIGNHQGKHVPRTFTCWNCKRFNAICCANDVNSINTFLETGVDIAPTVNKKNYWVVEVIW